jgi:4-hydroxy-tetrahydrodipicolinate reductase
MSEGIPDIINAPPGYVTTDKIPQYRLKPFNEYVK